MSTDVKIRYFAAAADAAGRDEESVRIEPTSTIEDLRRVLAERHGAELARVLDLCSFLVNGQAADPAAALFNPDESNPAQSDPSPLEPGEIRVDVLPPFAGG